MGVSALSGVVQLRASLGWFMGPQLTYRDLSSKPAKRRSESDLQCRRWADARTRWLPVLLQALEASPRTPEPLHAIDARGVRTTPRDLTSPRKPQGEPWC